MGQNLVPKTFKQLRPDTIQEELVFIRRHVCRHRDGFGHLVTREPHKYPCKITFVRIELWEPFEGKNLLVTCPTLWLSSLLFVTAVLSSLPHSAEPDWGLWLWHLGWDRVPRGSQRINRCRGQGGLRGGGLPCYWNQAHHLIYLLRSCFPSWKRIFRTFKFWALSKESPEDKHCIISLIGEL